MFRHPRRLVAAAALLTALTAASACTGPSSGSREPRHPDAPSSAEPSPAPSSPRPASSPSATAGAAPRRPGPVSLPALFHRSYDGRALALRRTVARTDAYTSYAVTYRSNGLRVSGKLDVPRGRGPFPAVVLAHGYIDPAVYSNGQGMRREQDWLARAGFVVLHTDYRNHAFSARDPSAERRLRLGYTVDVVNAVHALRRTTASPSTTTGSGSSAGPWAVGWSTTCWWRSPAWWTRPSSTRR